MNHIPVIGVTVGLFAGAWAHVSGFFDSSGFAVFLGWARAILPWKEKYTDCPSFPVKRYPTGNFYQIAA
jgi:hypothetical protein